MTVHTLPVNNVLLSSKWGQQTPAHRTTSVIGTPGSHIDIKCTTINSFCFHCLYDWFTQIRCMQSFCKANVLLCLMYVWLRWKTTDLWEASDLMERLQYAWYKHTSVKHACTSEIHLIWSSSERTSSIPAQNVICLEALHMYSILIHMHLHSCV